VSGYLYKKRCIDLGIQHKNSVSIYTVSTLLSLSKSTGSHIRTISPPNTPSSRPSLQPLPTFIRPKHKTRHSNQPNPIKQGQGFRLKDALKRWDINNSGLTKQATSHSKVEHLILKHANLTTEQTLCLRSTRQCVKHVEEYKARKSHGSVASRDNAAITHLVDVSEEGAEHDDAGRLQNAAK
jgi:hypothetical protein